MSSPTPATFPFVCEISRHTFLSFLLSKRSKSKYSNLIVQINIPQNQFQHGGGQVDSPAVVAPSVESTPIFVLSGVHFTLFIINSTRLKSRQPISPE